MVVASSARRPFSHFSIFASLIFLALHVFRSGACSGTGKQAQASLSAYSASKFAIRGLTQSAGARNPSRLARAILLVILARIRTFSRLAGRGGSGRVEGTAFGTSILTRLGRVGSLPGSLAGGH